MKIELLDGAMGTTISNIYNNNEKCREKINETNPKIIEEIHKKYIESGADYLKANTFNCSKKALEIYGEDLKKSYNYAFLGGKICKKIAEKYEKKSIGTFCDGDVDQIDGILDSGVDIIMVETIYDLEKGMNSLKLLKERMKIKKIKKPIMISFAVNEKGEIYSGEKILDVYQKFIDIDIISIGINCSEYTENIYLILKKFKEQTNLKVSFHPNSNKNIEDFIKGIKKLINDGIVDIVGGCCGTDFQHIKRLREIIDIK